MTICAFLRVLTCASTLALLADTASGSIADFGAFADQSSSGASGFSFSDGVTVDEFRMELSAGNTSRAGGSLSAGNGQANNPGSPAGYFRESSGGLSAGQHPVATIFRSTPDSGDHESAVNDGSEREVLEIAIFPGATFEGFAIRNSDREPHLANPVLGSALDSGASRISLAAGNGGVFSFGTDRQFVDNAGGIAWVSGDFYQKRATEIPSTDSTINPEPVSIAVWAGLAIFGLCVRRRR